MKSTVIAALSVGATGSTVACSAFPLIEMAKKTDAVSNTIKDVGSMARSLIMDQEVPLTDVLAVAVAASQGKRFEGTDDLSRADGRNSAKADATAGEIPGETGSSPEDSEDADSKQAPGKPELEKESTAGGETGDGQKELSNSDSEVLKDPTEAEVEVTPPVQAAIVPDVTGSDSSDNESPLAGKTEVEPAKTEDDQSSDSGDLSDGSNNPEPVIPVETKEEAEVLDVKDGVVQQTEGSSEAKPVADVQLDGNGSGDETGSSEGDAIVVPEVTPKLSNDGSSAKVDTDLSETSSGEVVDSKNISSKDGESTNTLDSQGSDSGTDKDEEVDSKDLENTQDFVEPETKQESTDLETENGLSTKEVPGSSTELAEDTDSDPVGSDSELEKELDVSGKEDDEEERLSGEDTKILKIPVQSEAGTTSPVEEVIVPEVKGPDQKEDLSLSGSSDEKVTTPVPTETSKTDDVVKSEPTPELSNGDSGDDTGSDLDVLAEPTPTLQSTPVVAETPEIVDDKVQPLPETNGDDVSVGGAVDAQPQPKAEVAGEASGSDKDDVTKNGSDKKLDSVKGSNVLETTPVVSTNSNPGTESEIDTNDALNDSVSVDKNEGAVIEQDLNSGDDYSSEDDQGSVVTHDVVSSHDENKGDSGQKSVNSGGEKIGTEKETSSPVLDSSTRDQSNIEIGSADGSKQSLSSKEIRQTVTESVVLPEKSSSKKENVQLRGTSDHRIHSITKDISKKQLQDEDINTVAAELISRLGEVVTLDEVVELTDVAKFSPSFDVEVPQQGSGDEKTLQTQDEQHISDDDDVVDVQTPVASVESDSGTVQKPKNQTRSTSKPIEITSEVSKTPVVISAPKLPTTITHSPNPVSWGRGYRMPISYIKINRTEYDAEMKKKKSSGVPHNVWGHTNVFDSLSTLRIPGFF